MSTCHNFYETTNDVNKNMSEYDQNPTMGIKGY